MPCSMIEFLGARLGVNGKQLVNTLYNLRRVAVFRVQFQCLEKLPSRMRPTAGMHDLGPAQILISGVAVALQDAFELTEKPLRSFASTPQAEVEHHAASRPAVLPQASLVVFATP